MKVQLKKGRDGPSTLACVRADGTRTWGKVHPFFPVHDLTHLAVESVLGLRSGFFGLVAAGWDIDDFAAPGAAARLPAEALLAEHMVGTLDREGAGPQLASVDEFNAALGSALRATPAADLFRPLTAAELAAIRGLRDNLAARWGALAPGDTLEAPFPAGRPLSSPGPGADGHRTHVGAGAPRRTRRPR